MKKKKIARRQLLAHRNYSSISNCQPKIFTIFQNIFIIFCNILKWLHIYSTLSIGTPKGVEPYGSVEPCLRNTAVWGYFEITISW
jgi:hypothetical protein